MTMQRWDKEQELMDAEVDQFLATLDEVRSVPVEKFGRLRTTLGQIRKVLVEEIEWLRTTTTESV